MQQPTFQHIFANVQTQLIPFGVQGPLPPLGGLDAAGEGIPVGIDIVVGMPGAGPPLAHQPPVEAVVPPAMEVEVEVDDPDMPPLMNITQEDEAPDLEMIDGEIPPQGQTQASTPAQPQIQHQPAPIPVPGPQMQPINAQGFPAFLQQLLNTPGVIVNGTPVPPHPPVFGPELPPHLQPPPQPANVPGLPPLLSQIINAAAAQVNNGQALPVPQLAQAAPPVPGPPHWAVGNAIVIHGTMQAQQQLHFAGAHANPFAGFIPQAQPPPPPPPVQPVQPAPPAPAPAAATDPQQQQPNVGAAIENLGAQIQNTTNAIMNMIAESQANMNHLQQELLQTQAELAQVQQNLQFIGNAALGAAFAAEGDVAAGGNGPAPPPGPGPPPLHFLPAPTRPGSRRVTDPKHKEALDKARRALKEKELMLLEKWKLGAIVPNLRAVTFDMVSCLGRQAAGVSCSLICLVSGRRAEGILDVEAFDGAG